VGAPDFVAEIVSPTDRYSDVHAKVRRYLADGVRLVWVIDQAEKTIRAHHPDSDQIATARGNSRISADPVIPNFELQLTQLFVPPLHTS
jgi:Uma2 family endonuclease